MSDTSDNNERLKAAWKTYTIAQQHYSTEYRQREAALYAINHRDLLLEMIDGKRPFIVNGISFDIKILNNVLQEELKKANVKI